MLASLALALQLHGDALTGRQFIPFSHFDAFTIETEPPDSSQLTSPVLDAGFEFNQLVVSWNIGLAPGAALKIEAQPFFGGRAGSFYTLGHWSATDASPDRRSVPDQSDPDGEVQTDVLVLTQPARKCRLRLTIHHPTHRDPTVLKFIGVSLLNSSVSRPATAATTRSGLERILPIPTRSQLNYPGGGAWCSPTSVSMVLNYWSAQLGRSDLNRDVPEVAAAVYDPGWAGTGNWPFNTAYAGSFPGMRAYVTRLATVDEVEAWIQAGVPVVASVTYSLLKGDADAGDGHLVVVVGFDEQGDVVINDPGTRIAMRKTVARERFAAAWSKSHHTVYLIHPSDHSIPHSEPGHW
jgi:uncharacterized protein YvpB